MPATPLTLGTEEDPAPCKGPTAREALPAVADHRSAASSARWARHCAALERSA